MSEGREDGESGILEVPSRLVIEKSWWIVSELIRRHPALSLAESHANGIYDLLILRSSSSALGKHGDPATVKVMINRVGTIQLHFENPPSPSQVLASWPEVVAARDPHEIVKRIESAARLDGSHSAPPTSPRTLAFRVLSAILTRKLNDRGNWDVRVVDESGGWVWTEGTVEPNLNQFEDVPTTSEFDRLKREGHVWFLLRDDGVLAALSEDGFAYFLRDRAIDLMALYAARRRLDDVVDVVLDRAEA